MSSHCFPSISESHASCGHGQKKNASGPTSVGAPQASKRGEPGAAKKCDMVTQDEIWKESVHSEKRGANEW